MELKEAERLHQEEALAQRQMDTQSGLSISIQHHVRALFVRLDPTVLDVNSTDPKQLARVRQQRLREQKRRELERYVFSHWS